jgi:pilus assembly protein CpaE
VAIIIDDPRSPVSTAIREFADSQIRERFGETVVRSSRRALGRGRVKR